jgi:hypothetical protein
MINAPTISALQLCTNISDVAQHIPSTLVRPPIAKRSFLRGLVVTFCGLDYRLEEYSAQSRRKSEVLRGTLC